MYADFITVTKLSLPTGQTRQAGNWGMASGVKTPWKGGVNFVRVGSVDYLQKGSKRVFWGCRSVLHLFHKWILDEILTKVPVVNTTNAGWSDQEFHVQLDLASLQNLTGPPPKKKIVPNSSWKPRHLILDAKMRGRTGWQLVSSDNAVWLVRSEKHHIDQEPRFPENQHLTIGNTIVPCSCSLWLWSSSLLSRTSASLLQSWLLKTTNTRRGQDLELEGLKVANGLLGRREEGEIVRESTTFLI